MILRKGKQLVNVSLKSTVCKAVLVQMHDALLHDLDSPVDGHQGTRPPSPGCKFLCLSQLVSQSVSQLVS